MKKTALVIIILLFIPLMFFWFFPLRGIFDQVINPLQLTSFILLYTGFFSWFYLIPKYLRRKNISNQLIILALLSVAISYIATLQSLSPNQKDVYGELTIIILVNHLHLFIKTKNAS